MPQPVRSQSRTIKKLLGGSDRIQPGEEARASRGLRQAQRQTKQNRPQPRQSALPRDSQERDMAQGMRQADGRSSASPAGEAELPLHQSLPVISQPGNEFDAETPDAEEKDEEQNPEQPESLAAQLRREKQEEKQKKEAGETKEEAESPGIAGGMKQGTNSALRFAWQLMLAIITFLPGLAYVNLHVFLHWVLGDRFFCKLGEEWMPKKLAALGGGMAGKMVTKNIGLVEVLLLILLDLAAGAIIFGALGLVVMIVTWMGASWWGKLTYIWEALWGLGWGGVKALVELFST